MTSPIIKGRSLSGNSFDRLLIIQSGDIGDVVLSTPSIAALRTAFPHSNITVAVRRKARELMDDCPWVDEVIEVDRTTGPLRRRLIATGRQIHHLRNAKFDLAIDLRTGTRGAIMAFLSNAPQRVSCYADDESHWRNKIFTHLADLPYELGTYVADHYHRVLKVFGLSSVPGPMRLCIHPDRQHRVDQICRKAGIDPLSPFVTLQPFSLWPYKDLPDNHYVQLINDVHETCGIPVVITGGPTDRAKAEAICRRCRDGIVNLAGKTTIGEMAGLLFRSRLFVGIDSAGLHIAAAVDCPTVGIFGPSSPDSWAPRGDRHRVVQSLEPCVPCRQMGCNNLGVSQCLRHLPVDLITAAIRAQVRSRSLCPLSH